MIESDGSIAVAALALMRSEKLSVSEVRTMLLRLRADWPDASQAEQVLDFAGVPRPGINMTFGEAARTIEAGLQMGIAAIPISSPQYPEILRGIADAPPILYLRGPSSVLSRLPGVAVVGTRKASNHGRTIAQRIAEFLSSSGWSVISGLALGIDAMAHEGAILGKTPTIAVLAHGLEKAQPVTNRPLAQRILEAGGAWVSEHPHGTPAKPANFTLRNRIQVGLSCASIIVEGEEKSGSMTQAEYCQRNKRTLFAVMPEPNSNVVTVSALPRMLIRSRGAIPIYSKDDYPSMLEKIQQVASQLQSKHASVTGS